jgi:hypothetical protein
MDERFGHDWNEVSGVWSWRPLARNEKLHRRLIIVPIQPILRAGAGSGAGGHQHHWCITPEPCLPEGNSTSRRSLNAAVGPHLRACIVFVSVGLRARL